MKRVVSLLIFLSLVLGFFSGTVGASGVNNFEFSDFKGEYHLSKDSSGHSEVKVVETFVAEFPEYNQNKGMVRAIPIIYNGHPLDFKLISVTRNGKAEPVFDQYISNDNQVIELGTNNYVLGQQEYQITYSLKNVTQNIDGWDEFYWNAIGDQFEQPFARAQAVVYLTPELQKSYTGQLKCYAGTRTSSISCESEYNAEQGVAKFTTKNTLPPQQSLTFVLGFTSETFTPYTWAPWQIFIRDYALYVIGASMLLVGGWALLIYRRHQTPKLKKALIPEYLPPKGVSVMESSGLVKVMDTVMSAQIIDLAVRHKIRIVEREKSQLIGKSKEYSVEVLNTDGLLPDELSFLAALAGQSVGSTYTLKKNDYRKGEKLSKIINNSQDKLLKQDGYLVQGVVKLWTAPSIVAATLVILMVVIMTSTKNFIGVDPAWGGLVFASLSTVGMFMGLGFSMSSAIYTQKGRELQHYLEGLKMYIKLAEKDRLAYLQSPTGADKTPVNTEDGAQMIKLYERVLPYAVLFSLEKGWSKVLEVKYQDTGYQPSWYDGDFARGLAIGSMVSGLNTASRSSFSAPKSSGGSGISGGFAGGGGGGGGGGGR